MTDDPTPFEPHQLDEVLSAALDGELDAAATDMGLSLDDVSARLRATPGAEARRAELSTARDLLAEPVDLDELVAARLRASAVRAHADTAATPLTASSAAASRRTQWLWRSAGIAAAIAGLGAVVFALGGSHSSSKSASGAPEKSVVVGNSTARTPGTTTKPSARTIQALGSFTSLHDLARAAVARDVAAAGALTPSAPFGNSNADQAALPSTSTADNSGAGTTQFQTAKDARRAEARSRD